MIFGFVRKENIFLLQHYHPIRHIHCQIAASEFLTDFDSWDMLTIIGSRSPVPESFHKNFVQMGTVVSEKIRFEFLYVHDLGPRSRNDIDLQYSLNFIYSIRCLLLLTFRSLAATVSEKSTVFTFSYRNTFSYRKACTKFDLAIK